MRYCNCHYFQDKVSELAQENTFLLSRLEPDTDNSEADINTLCHHITKLRDQLITASLHSQHPVDVESKNMTYKKFVISAANTQLFFAFVNSAVSSLQFIIIYKSP